MVSGESGGVVCHRRAQAFRRTRFTAAPSAPVALDSLPYYISPVTVIRISPLNGASIVSRNTVYQFSLASQGHSPREERETTRQWVRLTGYELRGTVSVNGDVVSAGGRHGEGVRRVGG